MPIASTLISHAEIIMTGLIGAGGSNTINTQFVFHYRRTATINPLSKALLAAAFQAGPGAPIVAMLNARWSEKTVSVRWMDDPLDAAVPFANVNVGGIAGDSMASHLAVFVLFRTGLRGRSFRGGKHFGPFSEADATTAGDDILNAAAIARLATTIAALGAPIVEAGPNTWNPCVYARSLSSPNLQPVAAIATNDIQTVLFNKRLGNMKRRMVRSIY